MRLLAQRRAQAARRWTTARSLPWVLLLLVVAAGTQLAENHLAEQDSDVLAQVSTERAAPVDPSLPVSAQLVAPVASPSIDRVARALQERRTLHRRASTVALEVTLLVLLASQVYLAWATRRLLSPPLVLATGLTALALGGGSEGRVGLLMTGALGLAALGLWRRWRQVS